MKTSASNYTVKRVSVVSQLPFEAVVTRFDSLIGHPDMRQFIERLHLSKSEDELTRVVQEAISKAQLMEFIRFDLGDVLKKRFGPQAGRSLRIVMGNPVTMSSMTIHVPDAGSYAPVTILIDERSDGVHLSYDRMASFLAPYENAEALNVAKDLDAKVEALIASAAA